MTQRAKRLRPRLKAALCGAVMAMVCVFIACDDLVYDDLSGCTDCTPTYTVRFTHTMNMSYADAFAHYVQSVTLCAFTSDGVLAYTQTAPADTLLAYDQSMDVADMPRGTYTLVAWAEGEEATADCYTRPTLTVGSTTIDELTCLLNRSYDSDGNAYIDHDLTPLFHGMVENADLTELDYDGDRLVEVDLTKDTNVVRVVLQHLSGEDIDVDDFIFRITDSNGWLDYDNSLLADEELSYHPWSTYSGTASVGTDDEDDDALTSVSVAIAELTVNRLTPDSDTRLTVYNAYSGMRVLSIPVVDYALLVKGNYNSSLTDQEYLDRQDEYAMTFFLDESGSWINTVIYINSWRVVLQDITM